MRSTTFVKPATTAIWLLGLTALLSAQVVDWRPHPGASFPVVGGNWANQRHSTLTKIDKSNIGRLAAPGWSMSARVAAAGCRPLPSWSTGSCTWPPGTSRRATRAPAR